MSLKKTFHATFSPLFAKCHLQHSMAQLRSAAGLTDPDPNTICSTANSVVLSPCLVWKWQPPTETNGEPLGASVAVVGQEFLPRPPEQEVAAQKGVPGHSMNPHLKHVGVHSQQTFSTLKAMTHCLWNKGEIKTLSVKAGREKAEYEYTVGKLWFLRDSPGCEEMGPESFPYYFCWVNRLRGYQDIDLHSVCIQPSKWKLVLCSLKRLLDSKWVFCYLCRYCCVWRQLHET